MSQEDTRSNPPASPTKEEKPGDEGVQPGATSPSTAEEYRKYRQAEREEEQRLERYERTSSTDTTHEKQGKE